MSAQLILALAGAAAVTLFTATRLHRGAHHLRAIAAARKEFDDYADKTRNNR